MTFVYDEGSSTPNLAGLVEVGSIRLNDGTFELLGAPGLFWGSPGLNDAVYSLSNDHGGFAGLPLYGPREFTLVVEISVPVLEDLWGAIELLMQEFNLSSTALKTLTLDTSGWAATRQIDARVAGEIEIDEPGDKNGHLATRRRVRIPMIAPDPRMYSTTLHAVTVTSGGTTLTNDGNMPTPFSVKFNGSQTAPLRLESPAGAGIELGASVTSGHYTTVNTRDVTAATATALDDAGANKFADVDDWSASVIPRGASVWTATKAAGAGTTVVSFRDAWI